MMNDNRDGIVRQYADGALTVEAAVQFSGIGRTTLYTLMESGELQFTKVGARRLIPRRALVELLSKNATSAADYT